MKRKLIPGTGIPIIFSLLPFVVLAQDYQIRLTHPFKVGDRHHYTATASQLYRAEVSSGGRELSTQEKRFTLELAADVTVLETDAKGHIIGESLVIENSKLTKDGATRALLPQGSTVIASVEGEKTVFKMNGQPLDAEISEAMGSAIATLDTGGGDDDEIFGTRSRKKIRESWPIDVDGAVEFVKEMDVQANKEDIKGMVTLQGVEGDRLLISGSLTIKPAVMPLPPEFKAEPGEFRAEFSGRFPIKELDANLQETIKAHITVVGVRPPSSGKPEIRLSVLFERSVEDEIKPIEGQSKITERAGAGSSTESQAGGSTAKGDASGEIKTVWIIPASFKGISPYEFVSVPAPSATPPAGVTVKTGVLVTGKAVKRVEPAYPPLARQAKIAGKVGVEIIVDEEGNVVWARATSGHPLLRDAALEAARQWKYDPTTLDGAPVKVLGAISLEFRN